jgi:outer membrane protein assembly factor BamB
VTPRSALAVAALVAASACGADGLRVGSSDTPRTVLEVREASTGQLRWTRDLAPTADATEPVIVGDVVLVAEPGADTTAYALVDGTPRWRQIDAALPPAVVGDLVVFDLQDRVEARRAATGRLVWAVPSLLGDLVQARDTGIVLVVDASRPAPSDCGTTADPCAVLPGVPAGVATGEVSLLDPATGRPTWTVDVQGRPDLNSSAVGSNAVLIGLSTSEGDHSEVVALGLRDGADRWDFRSDYVGGSTVHGDVVAVTTGTGDSTAHVLDATTGKELWKHTGEEGLLREAPFLGTTNRGTGLRRDPRTGSELPGRVRFTYGLAYGEGLLVGASTRTLTALRGDDPAWTAPLPEGPRPVSQVAVGAGVVAVVTGVGQEPERD